MRTKNLLIGLILICGLLLAILPFIGLNSSRITEYKLHGYVNQKMAEGFKRFILTKTVNDSVRIHIETFGGMVLSTNKILHYLTSTKASVICEVDSHAQSAGAMILAACETVKVKDYAEILFHISQVCKETNVLGKCSKRAPINPKDNPRLYAQELKEMESVRHLLTDEEWDAMFKGKNIILRGNVFLDRFKGKVIDVKEYN